MEAEVAHMAKIDFNDNVASHLDEINQAIRDRIAQGQLDHSEVDALFGYLLSKINLPVSPSGAGADWSRAISCDGNGATREQASLYDADSQRS